MTSACEDFRRQLDTNILQSEEQLLKHINECSECSALLEKNISVPPEGMERPNWENPPFSLCDHIYREIEARSKNEESKPNLLSRIFAEFSLRFSITFAICLLVCGFCALYTKNLLRYEKAPIAYDFASFSSLMPQERDVSSYSFLDSSLTTQEGSDENFVTDFPEDISKTDVTFLDPDSDSTFSFLENENENKEDLWSDFSNG